MVKLEKVADHHHSVFFLEGDFSFLVLVVVVLGALVALVPNLVISFGDLDLVAGDGFSPFLSAAFFWGDLERDLDLWEVLDFSLSMTFLFGDFDLGVGVDAVMSSLLFSVAFLLERGVGVTDPSLSNSLAFLLRDLGVNFGFS